MRLLTLARRVGLAALVFVPGVVTAQAAAYSLEDIVGMLKNRVPQRRIVDLAKRRCLDFVIDSRSEARLKETGGSATFVDELREVCNPNVPKPAAAAAAAAPAATTEVPIAVSFTAAIIDPDLTVRPIPQHDLIVMGPRGDTTRISTNLQGTATGMLLPGIYRIESAQPVELQGNRYRWSMFVPVQPGIKAIELTQRNATVEPVAAAAAPDTAAAVAAAAAAPPVAAPEPAPPPARSRRSEEAEIFEKYRSGLFVVFGEEARGSGFLIDSTGLVLTQADIVRGSDDIRIQLDSVNKVRARVVARDAERDIAILAINPARCAGCAAVPLADASAGSVAGVGERVLAAGSPLNRTGLMSIGIVNAVDAANVTSDVSISAMNAGGPLLNLDGRAVAVNLFNDGGRVGRPKAPSSLPVSSIAALIAAARDSLAKSGPPTDSLFPMTPPEAFPSEPIAALVALREPKLDAYQQKIGNVHVFMMTPQVAGWRQARANAELTRRRQEGKIKGIVDDRIDPVQHWADWPEYLTSRKAVVMFNVTPSGAAFPFYEPERIPAAGESIRKVKIYRDGSEIVPIEIVRIPAALTGPQQLAIGRPIPYQVINVYRASDFGPKPDGSQPNFSIAVQRGTDRVMPGPAPLDRRMVDLIIKDFTPFFVGLRMR